MENPEKNTALNVMKGIEMPDMTNNNSIEKFKKRKRKILSSDEYVEGIISGNISILSKAITLIESSLSHHKTISQEIVNKCLTHENKSVRIGFTGVPGVGKSTFIEAIGMHYIKQGKKIAVLAIDPSSERSGGSILGDKTRMEQLSVEKNAFIRPSPSSGSLGGVAQKTAETIILCEAAGYDIIFVETVGVGQSETAVKSMVDIFLLLMLAGAGDELQGIKRGIMEMADILVITKADGDNITKSKLAAREYKNALHLFPKTKSGWIPQVTTASAYTGDGVENLSDLIKNYVDFTSKNGFFQQQRNEQAIFRMFDMINNELKNNFYEKQEVKTEISKLSEEISKNKLSPYFAAKLLLDKYL